MPVRLMSSESDDAATVSRSLVTGRELDREAVMEVLSLALKLKFGKRHGLESRSLEGTHLALVFDAPCLPMRSAFETAARDQGAHVTYLGADCSEASLRDTARVLGAMYDGIVFGNRHQRAVEVMAAYAGVPVWNAVSDAWQPVQALADILTMTEYRCGDIEDIAFCFTGDARAPIAGSLLMMGTLLGMDVRIAAPRHYGPAPEVVDAARAAAAVSGARLTFTMDVREGVAGADFVYTGAWVTADEPDHTWLTRVPNLIPYRVNRQLMAASGRAGTRFMHCLPAVHDHRSALGSRVHRRFGLEGAEVTDEVFGSAASIVFQQAANLPHVAKALLIR